MFNNILIIGAHFDDAELGAGGVAARFVQEGKKVYKITLTDTEVISKKDNLNIVGDRAKENSANASAILGVEELKFGTSPYGNLEYSQKMMQELENIIDYYHIDTCFIHFKNDYNTDHLAAHKLCLTAARHCKNILMYQSNPYIIVEDFYPNVFFDISNFIYLKKKALACYDPEHNRQGNLFETNIARNKIWGYGNHVAYSEGFVAVKLSL